MDDILKAEFPLGERTILVRQPSEGQLLSLSLTRAPADGDIRGAMTVVQRVARVLERLIDPVAWENDVFGQLTEETITGRQFVDFALAVVRFDWAGARAQLDAPEPPPAPMVRTAEPEWVLSEAEKRALSQVETQPHAPRVVRGDG